MAAAGRTVLVVDDTEDHRTLAECRLRMGGYETITAVDGVDALNYLHTHALPDVILLDLRMPRLNGWDFLAIQQREAALARIPVVVHSCEHHMSGEGGFTPAVVCCVSKTDNGSVLLNAVQIALATAQERH